MTPALALGSLFWPRPRRRLIVVGGYWLAPMILCLFLPAGAFTSSPDGALPLAMFALFFIFFQSLPIVVVGYLILVFLFAGEARLEGCASGFPARLWVLPLPTYVLVGWPMLWGSATMVLVCMTLAWAARRPFGVDIPLAWPSLLLAVVLAWLQAILWTPFPLPLVRAFLLIPVGGVLFFTPVAILEFGVPSAAVCGLLAVLLSAAYLTAIRGVARARHGDNRQWRWPTWLRWPWAARIRPPFLSAARAQLWFEWRQSGLVFPVFSACLAAIWLLCIPPLFTLIVDDAESGLQANVLPMLPHELGILWLTVAGSNVLILTYVVRISGMLMGSSGWKPYQFSSFLATRPVSESMLIRIKFTAAAWSTLAGWGVLAIGLLLWLVLGSRAAETARQFEAMRQRHEPVLFWGWLVLLVGGTGVLIWLQMVQQMWAVLWAGWMRQKRAIAILVAISLGGIYAYIGLIVFSCWLAFHPEYRPAAGRLLPWLAGAAVLLKCLAATWSLHALKRRRLVPSAALWGMPAIWFVLAAGLLAALYALLPDDWFSVPGTVLGIVLLLPLTRLALAPLALSWNRHR